MPDPRLAPPRAARRIVVGQVDAQRDARHPVDPGGAQVVPHEIRTDDRVREMPVQLPRVSPAEIEHRAAKHRVALGKRREDPRKVAVVERHHRRVESASRKPHDPGDEARAPHLDHVGVLVQDDPPVRPGGEHEPVRRLAGHRRPLQPVAPHTVTLGDGIAGAGEHEHLAKRGARLDVLRLLPKVGTDPSRGLTVELCDVEHAQPRRRAQWRREPDARQVQPGRLQLGVGKEEGVREGSYGSGHSRSLYGIRALSLPAREGAGYV